MIQHSQTIKTQSLEQFHQVVDNFYQQLQAGDVVLLEGEIGVGKTSFVKRIGENMGINEPITSPTFVILKQYEELLCHIDAYRISQEDLEISNFVEAGFITFIEWSENISDFLSDVDYKITITYTPNLEERLVTIEEY